MMKLKMGERIVSKALISVILVGMFFAVLVGIYILNQLSDQSVLKCDPELREMVENTKKACDWCEKHKYIVENNTTVYLPICVGAGTCWACTEFYREYHNLTFEEFPTYCWRSDESPPC